MTVYCISLAPSMDTSARDTKARADAGEAPVAAPPVSGAGAGADEGAMKSCAHAEAKAEAATAATSSTATRGAIEFTASRDGLS